MFDNRLTGGNGGNDNIELRFTEIKQREKLVYSKIACSFWGQQEWIEQITSRGKKWI